MNKLNDMDIKKIKEYLKKEVKDNGIKKMS